MCPAVPTRRTLPPPSGAGTRHSADGVANPSALRPAPQPRPTRRASAFGAPSSLRGAHVPSFAEASRKGIRISSAKSCPVLFSTCRSPSTSARSSLRARETGEEGKNAEAATGVGARARPAARQVPAAASASTCSGESEHLLRRKARTRRATPHSSLRRQPPRPTSPYFLSSPALARHRPRAHAYLLPTSSLFTFSRAYLSISRIQRLTFSNDSRLVMSYTTMIPCAPR